MGSITAPFPYFGGKSRAAETLWSLLGESTNYVEPFAGSLAALLGCPHIHKVETVNDACGFVSNFWRSVQSAPDEVARFADWPVIENDLEARHYWLVNQAETLRKSLESPEFFDAKIAGWWVWGACAWIGSGWCSGKGPHRLDGNAGRGINRKIPHLGDAGRGINRQIPHLGDAGRGINRQIPHLGNAGLGINRQIPHLGNAGRGDFIAEWMATLAGRLRDVRVACGDWKRVVTESVTTRHGITSVFLDPPYEVGKMEYNHGAIGISRDVWDWALAHGNDPKLRIVVAAYEDGRAVPDGWRFIKWKARKGYAKDAAECKREALYASPHCLKVPSWAA
jgi:DNA adenine methylase